ncbi:response regulator [Pseudoalteromonas sp. MMG013]|uniref:response regulator n=1 Tax=unclassified Pseudoalteromonas TaxID=194690 RepID=UPI001B387A1B|nr:MULTISPECIES: response regulator [unclassified Pseudoalteromonas]MBQ4844585.1 response regulator [Pseudoalteromonas sp. MMG005]MBQ4860756.1 response regulator [Pseudoalteromonas sp. MMG013]
MSEVNYKHASILLVEDDDIDAKSVVRAFKKMRIANPIIRAKDGMYALELLKNDEVPKPFLILLDLNMPRMGGLELLAELRNDQQLKGSVVFVLTTSKDEQDKFAAYDQNIAGYIVKENLQHGFDELVKLLDHYWRIVELPGT